MPNNSNNSPPQFRRVTFGGAGPVPAHHFVGSDPARQEAFATTASNAATAATQNNRTGAVSLAIPSHSGIRVVPTYQPINKNSV